MNPRPLTPRQIELVRASFARVAQDVEGVSGLFYGRLFELEPALRALFGRSTAQVQGHKLMVMFGSVVANLHNLEAIAPLLRQLGKRHLSYGVDERHHAPVTEALLWTLERGLEPDFTPEVREAWFALYGFLAQTMQAGAKTSLQPRGLR